MKEQAKHEEPLGKDTIESEEAAKNKRKNYNMLIIILILLLVFLVPMFATYFVFNCDAFASWVEESSAGDFLGYFASFFALAATIVIAVKQTEISEKMYDIEDNLLKIEKNRARIEALGRGVEFTAIGIIRNKYNNQGIIRDKKEDYNPCYCKFGLVLEPQNWDNVKEFQVESVKCYSMQLSKNEEVENPSTDGMSLKCESSSITVNDSKTNVFIVYVNYQSGDFHCDVKMDYTRIVCKYSYQNSFGESFKGEISCLKYWGTSDELKVIYCRNEAE